MNLSSQSKGDEEEPAGGAVRPLLPRVLPAPLPALHQRLHSRHRIALKLKVGFLQIFGINRASEQDADLVPLNNVILP